MPSAEEMSQKSPVVAGVTGCVACMQVTCSIGRVFGILGCVYLIYAAQPIANAVAHIDLDVEFPTEVA